VADVLVVLEALLDRRLLSRDGPTYAPIGVVS
jgi:hypothetical protein